jgi:hypothetical protein
MKDSGALSGTKSRGASELPVRKQRDSTAEGSVNISRKSSHQPDLSRAAAMVGSKSTNRHNNSDRDKGDRYTKPNVVRLLYG